MARLYFIYISISNLYKNLKGRRNLKLNGKGKRIWGQEKKNSLHIFYLSDTKLVVRFPHFLFQFALIIAWGRKPNSNSNGAENWLDGWVVGEGVERIDELCGGKEAYQVTLARNDLELRNYPQRKNTPK